mmetsp:Transcript_133949/g.244308  ORF Transcript_133949/g.244308 Transcript_133949/m.244308 type:complete len:85 (-) Transcript_133949:6-260(-)
MQLLYRIPGHSYNVLPFSSVSNVDLTLFRVTAGVFVMVGHPSLWHCRFSSVIAEDTRTPPATSCSGHELFYFFTFWIMEAYMTP